MGYVLNYVVLYHQIGCREFFKVLEVKKSDIEGGGLGLCACCDFVVREMITLYLGTELDPNKNSIYLISNGSRVLECKSCLEEVPYDFYLYAHLVKDPKWKGGGEKEETINSKTRRLDITLISLQLNIL